MKLPNLLRRKKTTPPAPSAVAHTLQRSASARNTKQTRSASIVRGDVSPRIVPPTTLKRTSSERSLSELSSLYDSTVTATVTVTDGSGATDLFTSKEVATEDERELDVFLENGMLPCSPRGVADHADATIQQSRMMAQMGSLREAIAFANVGVRTR